MTGYEQGDPKEVPIVQTPSPTALRELLTRYATLRIALAEREDPAVRTALRAVTRALCEATRTDDPRDAVVAADEMLARGCCGAHPAAPAAA
ncbi:DUF5133 domain-containing protein [Streptomyces sp. NPDC002490]|uniref:DUF5133 domain-containing protein n=1 Tax=Streptomyces sp. NPDC002490 TaxID=3154416 RepID=UPI0033341745